ncbi:hypothetical protein L6164_011565 [Bauhinia variegata]|uniref:Uncharacterized protein n=1 Tax=Bauhinia variegata TaxID=167791 RepID=A0ACB9P767_BAUVA|nr:hypothetical protein L6164_011565 [Bauhinia variegata]
MVQLMNSGNLRPDLETASGRDKAPVKLEIEDPLEEEHGPLNKRSKLSSALQEWNASINTSLDPPGQLNILDEPSPLGLRLRKSPSLLDLIQMKLAEGSVFVTNTKGENLSLGVKMDNRGAAASASTDKLKASNFPASFLRIGSWEYKSRYEGDLVAKCYFAKHKLVWEVLEGGLKSKIEIQWSDIMALKANCPDSGPSTLTVVLARPPLFFRETNPQPRKHTLWQATADFTDGQASKHRQHFLQCPQGLLSKHFEKLIQCDMRLNFLSRQPEIVLDSPFFDAKSSALEDSDISRGHDLDQVNDKGFRDKGSPLASQSSSFMTEHNDPSGITLDARPREAPSSSSGSASSEIDSKGPRNWDEIKLPGMHRSISMSDFMSQIGHRISEQMTSGNPDFSGEISECQDILEDLQQYLLNDNQSTAASDEKSLMSRVNSLCCLLQKDPVAVQNSENTAQGPDNGKDIQLHHSSESLRDDENITDVKAAEEETKDVSGGNQVQGMSRKDSFGDLLLHLPRIASLPKFLFNISEEDADSQAR